MQAVEALLTALQAGGNVAMMALLFVMWRFDRRLLKLELIIFQRDKEKS